MYNIRIGVAKRSRIFDTSSREGEVGYSKSTQPSPPFILRNELLPVPVCGHLTYHILTMDFMVSRFPVDGF